MWPSIISALAGAVFGSVLTIVGENLYDRFYRSVEFELSVLTPAPFHFVDKVGAPLPADGSIDFRIDTLDIRGTLLSDDGSTEPYEAISEDFRYSKNNSFQMDHPHREYSSSGDHTYHFRVPKQGFWQPKLLYDEVSIGVRVSGKLTFISGICSKVFAVVSDPLIQLKIGLQSKTFTVPIRMEKCEQPDNALQGFVTIPMAVNLVGRVSN